MFLMASGINFSINIDRLFRYHLIGIGILALAYIFTVAGYELYGLDTMNGLTLLFDLDEEQNLPSLFSAAALFLLTGACMLCAKVALKDEGIFWKAMTVVFLFLALDEVVAIHEKKDALGQRVFLPSGIFRRAWVVPYGIATFIFAVLTLPSLVRLPASTRNGLVIAGGLYVTGAIGFELLGGVIRDYAPGPWITKSYSICVLCEEVLEMLGVALALRTSLLHFTGGARSLNLAVAAP